MKKLTVVSVLFLLLVACQNQENTEDAQQSLDSSTRSVTEIEAQQDEEKSTSQENEDIPPEYLDETNYTGDKLEIVKLMNARMRYLYEEDEKRYMNLFDPKSPISGMGRYKVLKVNPMSDITIQEQRKLFQAVVTVNELKENNEEYINTMVFWKKKEDGDNAQWVIADID
ncbi:hypothetical protein C161_08233 [Paenibacillus sp. FSL R5-192]|uniref:hypothetical protein n=1 Tax=Paenibacillus sp. FSL R5-192 TaxID=1226754 RepID=UPI0003E208A5|nr:hypothetical protein [Paenibacillus sp. FSL R5-192]ETT38097.1 hypothetical protein C161_08233 [Paenibacillus sp. FSL R5-192]